MCASLSDSCRIKHERRSNDRPPFSSPSQLASWHGCQVPTDRARGVSDANQTQSDEMLALAPNDVEVEERAAASGHGSEVVTERPAGDGAERAVDDVANHADFRGLLEPHEHVGTRILGGGEELALKETEVKQVEHSSAEARHQLVPERRFGSSLSDSDLGAGFFAVTRVAVWVIGVLRFCLLEQKQLAALPVYFHQTVGLRLKDPGMGSHLWSKQRA